MSTLGAKKYSSSSLQSTMTHAALSNSLTLEDERQKLAADLAWLRNENQHVLQRLKEKGAEDVVDNSMPLPPPPPGPPAFSHSKGSSDREGEKDQSQVRLLTLQKLKHLIAEIYTSKERYDLKCSQNSLPRETMEQHLYSFLFFKYGLKSLMMEWAAAVIHAVKMYSESDCEVQVFGKILRNEINEDFRFALLQMRSTIHALIPSYFRKKYPLRDEREIVKMCKDRYEGLLAEEEWVDLVKFMYDEKDSVSVICKLQEYIRASIIAAGRDINGGNKCSESPLMTMLYVEFVDEMMQIQVESQEKFLAKFRKLFSRFDTDNDGVLSRGEYRQLVMALAQRKSEPQLIAMCEKVDPTNTNRISFSDSVTSLVGEIAESNGKNRKKNNY